jgi:hypothetical protein
VVTKTEMIKLFARAALVRWPPCAVLQAGLSERSAQSEPSAALVAPEYRAPRSRYAGRRQSLNSSRTTSVRDVVRTAEPKPLVPRIRDQD